MNGHTLQGRRVLSDTDAAEIRRRYWRGKGESFASLAREMGVSYVTVRTAAFSQGAYTEVGAAK